MCAPFRSVAMLLSCLSWRSGAFVLNGAIRQYGHNCQPPTTATTADVSSLLHHWENTFTSILPAYLNMMWQWFQFLCSECRTANLHHPFSWAEKKHADKSLQRLEKWLKKTTKTTDKLSPDSMFVYGILSSGELVVIKLNLLVSGCMCSHYMATIALLAVRCWQYKYTHSYMCVNILSLCWQQT